MWANIRLGDPTAAINAIGLGTRATPTPLPCLQVTQRVVATEGDDGDAEADEYQVNAQWRDGAMAWTMVFA